METHTAKLAKGITRLRIWISMNIIMNTVKTIGAPAIAEIITLTDTSIIKTTKK